MYRYNFRFMANHAHSFKIILFFFLTTFRGLYTIVTFLQLLSFYSSKFDQESTYGKKGVSRPVVVVEDNSLLLYTIVWGSCYIFLAITLSFYTFINDNNFK